MLRKAIMQDVPRIAEIIVFGKRVAYRPKANGKTCLIEGTTKTDMCYELIL